MKGKDKTCLSPAFVAGCSAQLPMGEVYCKGPGYCKVCYVGSMTVVEQAEKCRCWNENLAPAGELGSPAGRGTQIGHQ